MQRSRWENKSCCSHIFPAMELGNAAYFGATGMGKGRIAQQQL